MSLPIDSSTNLTHLARRFVRFSAPAIIFAALLLLAACDQAGVDGTDTGVPGDTTGESAKDSVRLSPESNRLFTSEAFQFIVKHTGVISGYPAAWIPEDRPTSEVNLMYAAGMWLSARQNGQMGTDVASPVGQWNSNLTSTSGGVYFVTQDTLNSPRLVWPDVLPTNSQGEPALYGDAMTWTMLKSEAGSGEYYPVLANPLTGIRYEQTVFAYEDASARDAFFVRYEITNTSPHDLTEGYVAFRTDIDLGGIGPNHCRDSRMNKMAFDVARSLSYVYPDSTEGCSPSVAGYTLLETPGGNGVTAHPIVWKSANTASTGFYENDMTTVQAMRRVMRGVSVEGEPMINPVTNEETPFAYTGNPVNGEGWLMNMSNDVRGLISSGPFTIPAGETKVVTVLWVMAMEPSLDASLDKMDSTVDHIRNSPHLWTFNN